MKVGQLKQFAALTLAACCVTAGALAQDVAPQWKPPKPGEVKGNLGAEVRQLPPAAAQEASENLVVPQKPGEFNGKLVFDAPNFDFGEVAEGEVVDAAYQFTNSSDRAITISSVRASCGCTAAEPNKKVYEPGETGVIKAEFNSKGRPGHQLKTITVTTDEAPNATYVLKLSGVVLQEIYVEPKTAMLGDIRSDQETSLTLKLINVSGKPVKVLEATLNRTDFKAEVLEPEDYKEPKSGREGIATPIVLTVPKDARPGLISSLLSIKTDQEDAPPLHVPVRGTVLGDVNVEPKQAFFGVPKPGDVVSRSVEVRLLDAVPFEMKSYDLTDVQTNQEESPKPDMKVEVGEFVEGKQEVKLTLTVPNQQGRMTGNVLMKGTAGGKDIEVTVPYMVYVNTQKE